MTDEHDTGPADSDTPPDAPEETPEAPSGPTGSVPESPALDPGDEDPDAMIGSDATGDVDVDALFGLDEPDKHDAAADELGGDTEGDL